jgi:hypothetical protein
LRHDRPDLKQRRKLATVPVGWSVDAAAALAQQWALAPVTAGRWGVRGSFDIDWRGTYALALTQLIVNLRGFEQTPGHLRLLQVAGVTHVVSLHDEGFEDLILRGSFGGLFREPVRLYRVPGALPRSYVVGGARLGDGIAAIHTLADPTFDPAAELILPGGSPRPKALSAVGSSRIVEDRPDRVRVEATLSESGFLVLLDSFDPGWRATVDGRPAPLLRANLAFRAVALPPGSHAVEFLYRPASLVRGLALSLVALAGAIVLPLAATLRPR